MAGTITHFWNGSILTVTSDSGTSSADLSGPTGCRGPQGRPGVIYDEEGNLVLGDIPSGEEVDSLTDRVEALEEKVDGNLDIDIDLTGYATEEYVNAKVAQAQLEGAGIDMSAYYTKSQVDAALENAKVAVDGTSITYNDSGEIQSYPCHKNITLGELYAEYEGSKTSDGSGSTGYIYNDVVGRNTFPTNVAQFVVKITFDGITYTDNATYTNGELKSNTNSTPFVKAKTGVLILNQDGTVTAFSVRAASTVVDVPGKINASALPIDGITIYMDENGLLKSSGMGSGDGNDQVDVTNYYTKSEINSLVYNRAESDYRYYTKAEIDSLLANIKNYPSSEEVEY